MFDSGVDQIDGCFMCGGVAGIEFIFVRDDDRNSILAELELIAINDKDEGHVSLKGVKADVLGIALACDGDDNIFGK